MEKKQKENIKNIPNILTFSRVIIAFIVIFFIFANFEITWIILAFLLGMITDVLDGQIARRFKMTTEFGARFDMVADRFLMVGVALTSVLKLSDFLSTSQLFQIFLILGREIVAFSGVLISLMAGKGVFMPKASIVGKATTFFQAITFPMILLSAFYPVFKFSIYFAVLTCIIGSTSGFCYIRDVKNFVLEKK